MNVFSGVSSAALKALVALCMICCAGGSAQAAPAARPLTIAYIETGEYWEFTEIMTALRDALAARDPQHRMVFPADLHFSPGYDAPDEVFQERARLLMNTPGIDCIISMGTVPTKALLAANNGRTPIMAIDISDPEGVGFVNSTGTPVAQNLVVQFIPNQWQNMFNRFYLSLPFSRLGIMYYDTPAGRSYSNVREAREVARDLGFTLVEYSELDAAESRESCKKGVQALLQQQIDAFYVSQLKCFDWTNVRSHPAELLNMLHNKKVRTFASDGAQHVQRGALMGMFSLNTTAVAEFYASHMASLLGLTTAGGDIHVSHRLRIAINIDTARKLGLKIPLSLLVTADQLFDERLPAIKSMDMLQ